MEKSEWMVTANNNFVVPNGFMLKRILGIQAVTEKDEMSITHDAEMIKQGIENFNQRARNAMCAKLREL